MNLEKCNESIFVDPEHYLQGFKTWTLTCTKVIKKIINFIIFTIYKSLRELIGVGTNFDSGSRSCNNPLWKVPVGSVSKINSVVVSKIQVKGL
jgi:hypothetical protein